MVMHIQIERATEPLHRKHRTRMSQLRRLEPQDPLRLHPQEVHHHLHHRSRDSAAESAIVGQKVAQRQAMPREKLCTAESKATIKGWIRRRR